MSCRPAFCGAGVGACIFTLLAVPTESNKVMQSDAMITIEYSTFKILKLEKVGNVMLIVLVM